MIYICLTHPYIPYSFFVYITITMVNLINQASCLVAFILLAQFSVMHCGVIEVTYNNLHKVLVTYEEVYLLFHNPQCLHSRNYAENFLKLETDLKLGMVDCLREIQLCREYNHTSYPLLAKYYLKQNINENSKKEVHHVQVDEYQFLVDNGVESETSEKVLHNRIVAQLEQQPNYVVLILEEEGLPVQKINKLRRQNQTDRVFYFQPATDQSPSHLSDILFKLVNMKHGCWIISYDQKQQTMNRYYCGDGHNAITVRKFIDQFLQKKLDKYIFENQNTVQSKSKNSKFDIGTQQLNEIMQENQLGDLMCKTVYFYSEQCPQCSYKDIAWIQQALVNLKIQDRIYVYKFNLDQNQLNRAIYHKGMKRVPELMLTCFGQTKFFGKIFYKSEIENFFANAFDWKNNLNGRHNTRKQQQQQL